MSGTVIFRATVCNGTIFGGHSVCGGIKFRGTVCGSIFKGSVWRYLFRIFRGTVIHGKRGEGVRSL